MRTKPRASSPKTPNRYRVVTVKQPRYAVMAGRITYGTYAFRETAAVICRALNTPPRGPRKGK